ncbi:MAG: aminotransferase class V-fold PLP-dependent enzyme [Microbacteriaceae bacterium]
MPTPLLTVEDAAAQFTAGRGYLSACTMGLPIRATIAALAADAARWAAGTASAAEYGAIVEQGRNLYARIVNVPVERVAIGSQTSVMAEVIASSIPDGAEVLCVDGDFSSMVFPFLAQAHRGVSVRHASLGALADSISSNTALVAFSLVQSATGAIADADAVTSAAKAHDAWTLCDTTQAVGWLPVDAGAFDATVCHGYKWLCCPRGVAFLTVSERLQPELRPVQAGWYAGADPWASCYGPQMQLADTARRFDVSPAWQAWAGTTPALSFFSTLDIPAARDHAVRLGDLLCDGLDIARAGQAIVTWPDADGACLGPLTAAGITISCRSGRARAAFHLWNDEQDVANTLEVLGR